MAIDAPTRPTRPVSHSAAPASTALQRQPDRPAPLAQAQHSDVADVMEMVLGAGDLSKLDAGERTAYLLRVCESLGLNPLTQPFEYIRLNDKLRLYAKKDATDQLRRLHRVSVQITGREHVGDLHIVTALATLPDGRTDEEIGAVSVQGLAGDALANALMKAGTKAKRRVTLAICGLGFLDETELETIRDAVPGEHVAPAERSAQAPARPAATTAHKATMAEREFSATPEGREVEAEQRKLAQRKARWASLVSEAELWGVEHETPADTWTVADYDTHGTALRAAIDDAQAETEEAVPEAAD